MHAACTYVNIHISMHLLVNTVDKHKVFSAHSMQETGLYLGFCIVATLLAQLAVNYIASINRFT